MKDTHSHITTEIEIVPFRHHVKKTNCNLCYSLLYLIACIVLLGVTGLVGRQLYQYEKDLPATRGYGDATLFMIIAIIVLMATAFGALFKSAAHCHAQFFKRHTNERTPLLPIHKQPGLN